MLPQKLCVSNEDAKTIGWRYNKAKPSVCQNALFDSTAYDTTTMTGRQAIHVPLTESWISLQRTKLPKSTFDFVYMLRLKEAVIILQDTQRHGKRISLLERVIKRFRVHLKRKPIYQK